MVEYDAVQQAFYKEREEHEVTIDDVMLFVNHEKKRICDRFANTEFLPPYYAYAEQRMFLSNVDEKQLNALKSFFDSDDFRFKKSDKQNQTANYEMAETFIGIAFELFELLQNISEHAITRKTIEKYCSDIEPLDNGFIEATFCIDIPSCDYLQFISDGCDKISGSPFWWNCLLHPLGEESEHDDVLGWVTSKSGAVFEFTSRIPNNDSGYRSFLNQLLIVILDLHLHDVQMATYGIGKHTLISKHVVSALWVKLREELGGGRAGVCRVCGRPFIAHNERKEKARYCIPNGSCQQAYMRTKRVLVFINDGYEVKDAVSKVNGIGVNRFLEIALRNRYIFEQEFERVDFDKLFNE